MDSNFLLETNWPTFGQGVVSGHSKTLHEWCGNISKFVLELSNHVKLLEEREKEKDIEINKLKSELSAANKTANSSNNSSKWIQTVKQGTKNAKKPADQIAVENATISEMNERNRRKKNVIIYGVPESKKEILADKKAEDEAKINEILSTIGKSDIKPAYSRRLRSKDQSKPGPILVELKEEANRNPLLLAAKKLRDSNIFKSVYLSPDLTETERALDYELRKQRNEANNGLSQDSPFRYGIRGNQIVKFKKQ